MLKLRDSEPFQAQAVSCLYSVWCGAYKHPSRSYVIRRLNVQTERAKRVVSGGVLCTYFDEFTFGNDARICVNICTPLFACNTHSRISTWRHPQLSSCVSYELLRFSIFPRQAMKAQRASRCTVPLGLSLLLDGDERPTSRSDPWHLRPDRNPKPIQMEAWLVPEPVWMCLEMEKTPPKGSRSPASSGRSLEDTPTLLPWHPHLRTGENEICRS